MDSTNNSLLKFTVLDTISKSNELIKTLSSMVASCPVCQSKLLNQKNNAGVTSSSQTGRTEDDDTTPAFQARGNINHNV